MAVDIKAVITRARNELDDASKTLLSSDDNLIDWAKEGVREIAKLSPLLYEDEISVVKDRRTYSLPSGTFGVNELYRERSDGSRTYPNYQVRNYSQLVLVRKPEESYTLKGLFYKWYTVDYQDQGEGNYTLDSSDLPEIYEEPLKSFILYKIFDWLSNRPARSIDTAFMGVKIDKGAFFRRAHKRRDDYKHEFDWWFGRHESGPVMAEQNLNDQELNDALNLEFDQASDRFPGDPSGDRD